MHFNEAVTKWDSPKGNSVEWATRINRKGISEKTDKEIKTYIIKMITINACVLLSFIINNLYFIITIFLVGYIFNKFSNSAIPAFLF